jgi:hypothetical protein
MKSTVFLVGGGLFAWRWQVDHQESQLMRFFAVYLVCVLLSSCAAPASRERLVALVESQPAGSTYVGRVSVTTEGKGTLLYRQTYQEALDGALNQAEFLGATHLVLDKLHDEPLFWGSSQSAKGNAYRLR